LKSRINYQEIYFLDRNGEFIVFDLIRPEDDPLAIRLRFDTPLNLQKEIEARQKRKEKSASANE
jgi:hypothetical protein